VTIIRFLEPLAADIIAGSSIQTITKRVVRNAGCTTHARGDDGEVEDDDDDATPRLRNLKARSGGILPEASNCKTREIERRARQKRET
jgi:hypothetical protein